MSLDKEIFDNCGGTYTGHCIYCHDEPLDFGTPSQFGPTSQAVITIFRPFLFYPAAPVLTYEPSNDL